MYNHNIILFISVSWAIRCRVPSAPLNGYIHVDAPAGKVVKPGTTITYTCQRSYYIDLSESPDYDDYTYYDVDDFQYELNTYERTCGENGKFDGLNIPECKCKSILNSI